MSEERLKKTSAKLAGISKGLYIAVIVFTVIQFIGFLWLAIMPNKGMKIFDFLQIFRLFISDKDNVTAAMAEFSVWLVSSVFLFSILRKMESVFLKLDKSLDFCIFAQDLKCIALLLSGRAIAVYVTRTVSYSVFVKALPSVEAFDFSAIAVGTLLWFIGYILEMRANERL